MAPFAVEAMAQFSVEERRRQNWDVVAYCLRYGNVDVSDWPKSDALNLAKSLAAIIAEENKSGRMARD